MKTAEEVEGILDDALDWATKNGFHPVRGHMNDGRGGCCAVGAFKERLAKERGDESEFMRGAVVLNIPEGATAALVSGFDGRPQPEHCHYPDFYEAGKRLASKWLPKEKW